MGYKESSAAERYGGLDLEQWPGIQSCPAPAPTGIMIETIKKVWHWIFSLQDRERPVKDAAEKLQMSMRVTAKCRYNAAVRLQRQGNFAFFTTTLLSLGLIFIPLMQNAGVPLAFKANVLNMMQIFLAVAVLVYSVVIGTARY